MIKKIFIFFFSIFSFGANSQSESSNEEEKLFGIYPFVEFGYNHNNNYLNSNLYPIYNSNIGMGISLFNFKMEFSYPFLQSFDSTRLFGNSFSGSIAYSIKTKNINYRIIPRINLMGYQTNDHLTTYDTGNPNVSVPVRYIKEIKIRKITYSIGMERELIRQLKLGIDFGLSFFKVDGRAYSEIDGTETNFHHEFSHPDQTFDLVKMFIGIRIIYLIQLD